MKNYTLTNRILRTLSLGGLIILLALLGIHIYKTISKILVVVKKLELSEYFLDPRNIQEANSLAEFRVALTGIQWQFAGLLIGSFLILVLLYFILENRHNQLRSAEMISRNLNQKLNVLLQNRKRLIFLLDSTGKVKEYNDAGAYFGLEDPRDVLGLPIWELQVFKARKRTLKILKNILFELNIQSDSEAQCILQISPTEVKYCQVSMEAIRIDGHLEEVIVEITPIDTQYRSSLNRNFLATLQGEGEKPLSPLSMLHIMAEKMIEMHNYDIVQVWELFTTTQSNGEKEYSCQVYVGFPKEKELPETVVPQSVLKEIDNNQELVFKLSKESIELSGIKKWRKYGEVHILRFNLIKGKDFFITAIASPSPFMNWDFDAISKRAQATVDKLNRSQLWYSLTSTLVKQENAEFLAGMGSFEFYYGADTISVSKAFKEMVGLQTGETKISSKVFLDFFQETSREILRNRVAELGKGNIEVYRGEHNMEVGPEKTSKRVILQMHQPHSSQDGDLIIGVIFDITEEFELQEAKEALLQELQRSNQELEQFAYIASHDLQEPLRKIRAFGDLLLEQYKEEELPGLNYVQRMQKSSARMQTLIDDLLVYSRVSRDDGEPEEVDLERVIEIVLSDLGIQIEETGAKINLYDLPKVMGKSSQMRRLFQNLISNAMKFQTEGAKPEITIAFEPAKVTDKSLPLPVAENLANFYKITVRDNGIGFDMKYLEKVFAIFQRLHGRTKYSGTGIGLAVCKKVVENHDGYLAAYSEPGKGAKFYIYLPLERLNF